MSLMQHNGQHSPRVSLVYLQLICAMLFFGLSFVFTAIALGELGPITIIMVRLCVSVLILLLLSQVTPVTAIVGKLENIKKGHRRYFVILAIFQPFLYFLCENTGLLYASPAVTSIVIATIPVVTPVFAFFLLKERITLFTVLGALLSLGGVGIIVLAGGEEGGAHPLGVALVFGAVLAAVGYSIAIRYVPNRYSPLSIVAWQNSMGLVFFAPLLLIFEPPLATLAELPGPHVLGALLFFSALQLLKSVRQTDRRIFTIATGTLAFLLNMPVAFVAMLTIYWIVEKTPGLRSKLPS